MEGGIERKSLNNNVTDKKYEERYKKSHATRDLIVNDGIMNSTSFFKYLGTTINSRLDNPQDITLRREKARN